MAIGLFFFFNRSGKVIDDYVDKNLGHNDGIDNDDDDDDDGDALADFKRWAYHLKTAAKQDLDILVVFLGCFGALCRGTHIKKFLTFFNFF